MVLKELVGRCPRLRSSTLMRTRTDQAPGCGTGSVSTGEHDPGAAPTRTPPASSSRPVCDRAGQPTDQVMGGDRRSLAQSSTVRFPSSDRLGVVRPGRTREREDRVGQAMRGDVVTPPHLPQAVSSNLLGRGNDEPQRAAQGPLRLVTVPPPALLERHLKARTVTAGPTAVRAARVRRRVVVER